MFMEKIKKYNTVLKYIYNAIHDYESEITNCIPCFHHNVIDTLSTTDFVSFKDYYLCKKK